MTTATSGHWPAGRGKGPILHAWSYPGLGQFLPHPFFPKKGGRFSGEGCQSKKWASQILHRENAWGPHCPRICTRRLVQIILKNDKNKAVTHMKLETNTEIMETVAQKKLNYTCLWSNLPFYYKLGWLGRSRPDTLSTSNGKPKPKDEGAQ